MTENSTVQALALELKREGFSRRDSSKEPHANPVAPIPLVVTLDQLRPYEHNPRCTKNPLYDDIKSSIRERGLDNPPAITRRPSGEHYIIRNGGNTRLAVLTELWYETHDERFYRIPCMLHPWPERGDIVLLTGHLTESDLHEGLTYIERALAVEKTRKLYEQESGDVLTQRELARRLKADGYPIPQPHISRMREAIEYLLPAIPNVLYSGLGRPQIERLSKLRRTAEKIWAMRNADQPDEFFVLFQETLSAFDEGLSSFDLEHIQDELTGRMAEALGIHYDTLAAEITLYEQNRLQTALTSGPSPWTEHTQPKQPKQTSASVEQSHRQEDKEIAPEATVEQDRRERDTPVRDVPVEAAADDALIKTTERLQSLRGLVAGQSERTAPETGKSACLPAQVDGLYPITDVWGIPPELDAPERLRIQIAQFAREIAHEVGLDEIIVAQEHGIGFACVKSCGDKLTEKHSRRSRGVLTLLHALSQPYLHTEPMPDIDLTHLSSDLGIVLLDCSEVRLSDHGLIKLFRLIRLSRRLLEGLDAASNDDPPGS